MALVLQGLLDDETLVYLDDVLICTETIQEHQERLRRVFQRLQQASLTINPAKCKFFQDSLTFLGHTISGKGIQPNLLKVKAVRDYPSPSNPKEIKQFLGLAGFYRGFVKNYGHIAAPMTDLLKKDAKFDWGEREEQAFKSLKEALTTAPILAFPDYGLPFHLYTDASNIGLGAVLMQRIAGHPKPIAFASRVLSQTERRYHTTDKEMLAAVWGLQHFREIILGYKVILWTDHNPITTTLDDSYKDPHGRKARYQLTIADFDVKINYIKGVNNTPPDALSRVVIQNQDPSHDLSRANPLDFPPPFATPAPARTTACALVPGAGPPTLALKKDEISKALREDPIYSRILDALSKDEETPTFSGIPTKELTYDSNLLYRVSKPKRIRGRKCVSTRTLVLPDKLVPNVLRWAHEGMFHQGLFKTVKHIRDKYFFPRLVQRVSKHVRSCKTCPLYKGSTGKQAPYGCYDIPSKPWERVFSDILSLPPSAKGNRHLLVFIDQMSRYCELAVIQDKSAETIAKALHDNIICRHGCPSYFIHDNAKEFTAQVIERLCKLTKIEQPNIMAYRPQANAFSERLNRSILGLLRTMTADQKLHWCDFIPSIQGAINGSFQSALGDSPDFLLKGYDKRLTYELLWGQTLPLYTSSYSDAIIRNTQVAWKRARQALTETRDKALQLEAKKPYQEKIQ
ncbi:MAG: RNase H-like domain-containing protein, partial [Cyanobacteria bacterium J06553_1]